MEVPFGCVDAAAAVAAAAANWACCAGVRLWFAIANPDAAIALAKPVGLREADDALRQGLFFSWGWLLRPLVDIRDTESESRGESALRKLEPPAGTVAECTIVGGGEGYSGGRIAVGDSTRGGAVGSPS